MNKITFIIPPQHTISVTSPLGIGYLASAVKSKGFQAKILDFAQKRCSLVKAAQLILNEKPTWLCVTSMTHNYEYAKKIITAIKLADSNIKIIIGGAHVSALPEYSLYDTGADIAVVGEGEEVLPEIIKRYNSGTNGWNDIKGIAFWNKGVVKINPGLNVIEDLDSLPFPAWDLIPPQSYKDSPGYFYSRGTSFPIITSRGCPHHCSFCSSWAVHGRRLRLRNPKTIADEIELLIDDFGVQYFDFSDDNFTEDRGHALAVCNEIVKRGLNIGWKTPVGIRLDNVDSQLLSAMKKAGCYELGFGIESYDENVLRINNKPLNRAKVLEKIRLVKQFGIETIAFFILGLPGDTKKSILDTIAFAKKSPFDLVSFSCAVPIPGSELFGKVYTKDDLQNIDWAKFSFDKQFNLSGIPPKVLRNLFRRAILNTYVKPSRLMYLLKILSRLKISSLKKILKYVKYFLIK